MAHIDEEIDGMLNQMAGKKKKELIQKIKQEKYGLLRLGEFSFFHDMLFWVEYGLTLKGDKVTTYSYETYPYFGKEYTLKIPGSIGLYEIEEGDFELMYFPTIKDIKKRIKNRLRS